MTGIGRYNEMIYIFDVLKQNHQFELLLGKGMEKVSLMLNNYSNFPNFLDRYVGENIEDPDQTAPRGAV